MENKKWFIVDDREEKNGEKKIWIQEGYGNWNPVCDMVGMSQMENAQRIVACVNACEGIPTEKLENAKLIESVFPTPKNEDNAPSQ